MCLEQCQTLADSQSLEQKMERDYSTDAEMIKVKMRDIQRQLERAARKGRLKRAIELERKGDRFVKGG